MAPGGPDDPYGQRGRKVDARMVVAIVVVVLLVIFVFQNTAETPLRFLFFEFSWPLWLVVTIVALLGFVIGWLVGRRRPSSR